MLQGAYGLHDTWGRAVFPIFGLILAMNLLRVPNIAMAPRIPVRMLAVGAISSLPYVYLAGQGALLNIMFTLAGAAVLCALLQQRLYLVALPVFVLAGFAVDYMWFGLLYIVGAWWLLQRRVPAELVVALGALVLHPINGSLWALLAAPLVYLIRVGFYGSDAPRLKWAFYAAYPLHLCLLAGIKATG